MPRAVLLPDSITHQRKLHFALELSNSTWVVAFADGSAAKPKIYNVSAGNREALLDAVARARKAFRLGPDVGVASCYEAGRDGFWIHRWLVNAGISNTVVEPATLAGARGGGRKPKTDKLDAVALVNMLVRATRGERDVWRVVRSPSEGHEDGRRGSRYRKVLVKERIQHASRIASHLLTVGARVDKTERMTVEHLDGLVQWNGEPLPPELRKELELEIERLTLVRRQLSEIDKALKAVVEVDPLSKALMALKGVGWKSANVLNTEFYGWRDFQNGRQIGALAGLVGTPFRSGAIAQEQGISKAGNRRVRATAIELAWFWLRHQPRSKLTLWFHARMGPQGTSRQRRKLIVALARRLLIALWRYLKDGEVPEGADLKEAAKVGAKDTKSKKAKAGKAA